MSHPEVEGILKKGESGINVPDLFTLSVACLYQPNIAGALYSWAFSAMIANAGQNEAGQDR
jgi:hypothetical protein